MTTKSESYCAAPACGREVWAHGLCRGHWDQQERGEEFHELRAYRMDKPHTCTKHPEGTPSCYNRCACRCARCRAANTRARKQSYARKTSYVIDAVGSRRRLQALATLGWTSPTLAKITGIHERYLPEIRGGRVEKVTLRTARKIVTAYSALCMTPSTVGTVQSRSQTIAFARRQGWAGPLAWDNIDDPNESPIGVEWSSRTAYHVDVHEVVGLVEAGVPLVKIADRLGKSVSGIEKKMRKEGYGSLIDRLQKDRRDRGLRKTPQYGEVA